MGTRVRRDEKDVGGKGLWGEVEGRGSEVAIAHGGTPVPCQNGRGGDMLSIRNNAGGQGIEKIKTMGNDRRRTVREEN